MSKNVVETEGPQMTSQYGAYALHAILTRLHALMRMNMPTRPGTHMHACTDQGHNNLQTRLNAKLHVHCPSCYSKFEMEVRGSASRPGHFNPDKEPRVPIKQETGRTPEAVLT
jgi:hypothetical protein